MYHYICYYFNPKLWVDDAIQSFPFAEVLPFFRDTEKFGPWYGFFLQENTAILSMNVMYPHPLLLPSVVQDLNSALQEYTNNKPSFGGITIISLPGRSSKFIT